MAAPNPPVIERPYGEGDFSTSIQVQTFSGTVDGNVVDIFVNGISIQDIEGAVFEVPSTPYDLSTPREWSFPWILRSGENQFLMAAENDLGESSATVVFTVLLTTRSALGIEVSQVTNIEIERFKDRVRLTWQGNDDPNLVGYYIYNSLEAGGGLDGYTRLNDTYVETPDSVNDDYVLETTSRRSRPDESLSEIVGEPMVLYDGPVSTQNSGVEADTIVVYSMGASPVEYELDIHYTVETGDLTHPTRITRVASPPGGESPIPYGTTVLLNYDISPDRRLRTEEIQTTFERREFFVYDDMVTDDNADRLNINTDNYYVITAVAFDPVERKEVESLYSEELVGRPVILDTILKDLEVKDRRTIVVDHIRHIIENDPTIEVKPGSVLRDLNIDPKSEELARLYVVVDFVNRSGSFKTLLQLDDEDNDGFSDPVSESSYKQTLRDALNLDDEEVQTLIDEAFDKLALNVFVLRQGAEQAIGEIVFYSDTIPTADVIVNTGATVSTVGDSDRGIDPVYFTVSSGETFPVEEHSFHYVPQRRRYEFMVPIIAREAGDDGNVDALSITASVSGVSGVTSVTNLEATLFGRDRESNDSLAERALIAFISVDAGTRGGYRATALRQANVYKENVIAAGDPEMMRDLDELRNKHVFGKVDVYIQGEHLSVVTEALAFDWFGVEAGPGVVVDAEQMIVAPENESISALNPIFEVTSVVNKSRTAYPGVIPPPPLEYNLTGMEIVNGVFINLNEAVQRATYPGIEPLMCEGDILEITYKWRQSEDFILSNQPVTEIESVVGEVSGALTEGVHFDFYKTDDPLLLGRSTAAQAFIRFRTDAPDGLPAGGGHPTTDERMVLIAEIPVSTANVGVFPETVEVWEIQDDGSRGVQYVEGVDYYVTAGDAKTPATVERISTGSIANGEEVSVDYESGENFRVTYTVNALVIQLQGELEEMRHLTADVLAKEALETNVDIEMTVILRSGTDQAEADRNIRTEVSRYIGRRRIGQNLYQSDIIGVVEQVPEVDYLIVPLTRMARADGSFVIRERVRVQSPNYWSPVPEPELVDTYVTAEPVLEFPTVAGGGPVGTFKAVYEYDFPLDVMDVETDVQLATGRAYIRSDGRLVVSPSTRLDTPMALRQYYVSYQTYGVDGPHNIRVTGVEYVSLGDFFITYGNPED